MKEVSIVKLNAFSNSYGGVRHDLILQRFDFLVFFSFFYGSGFILLLPTKSYSDQARA